MLLMLSLKCVACSNITIYTVSFNLFGTLFFALSSVSMGSPAVSSDLMTR